MDIYSTLLVAMISGVILFQILIVLGLPLGRAAWGGKHTGVLPNKLRFASVFSAAFLGLMATVLLSDADQIDLFPDNFENIFLWFMTVYFALGIVMNAISKSKAERLWAPYIAIMFVLSLIISLSN